MKVIDHWKKNWMDQAEEAGSLGKETDEDESEDERFSQTMWLWQMAFNWAGIVACPKGVNAPSLLTMR